MAMGVVTDFVAIDMATSRAPPKSQTRSAPETVEVKEPASSAQPISRMLLRTCPILSASGTDSATVAGPSRKLMNGAPLKDVWEEVSVSLSRSEGRRVGQEWGRTCRYGASP